MKNLISCLIAATTVACANGANILLRADLERGIPAPGAMGGDQGTGQTSHNNPRGGRKNSSDNSSGRRASGRTTGSSSSGSFANECLKGRFGYFNTAAGTASLSVAVFDGNGGISEMGDLEINHPSPDGGRDETSIGFNSGTFKVEPSGKGKMYISLGEEGEPYFDPPAEVMFVVSGTASGCEITTLDSFVSAGTVGVADQLVVPRWTKIADE